MKTLLRELVSSVLLVMLLSAASSIGLDRLRVDGLSMAPTLEPGQHLLANKLHYSGLVPRVFAGFEGQDGPAPARGDIVIFHPPTLNHSVFVKRVVGLPGETIAMHRGVVHVEGIPIEEPYVLFRDSSTTPPVQVPAGHVFVLGDNRPISSDSRAFGPVPLRNIEGVAWLRYWPPHLAPALPFRAAE